MKSDATLVAEGLHPKDVAWLQERVDTLEGALREQMVEVDGQPHAYACPKAYKLERECDSRCTAAVEALKGDA